MVNTVENNHSICIEKQREEPEDLLIIQTKKRKCDDMIVNNSKNTKQSNTMENKCLKCKRKLTLAGCYKCRCGNNYCNRHRFHDQHECTFDFKSLAIAKLKIENPKLQNRRIGE